MPAMQKKLKISSEGHSYYKSSDCPICPYCEGERKPIFGFLANLSAPARRALEKNKILTLEKLAKWSEKELLALHGLGPSTIPKLKDALESAGLKFRN
jgi:hypothetical protein